MFIFVHAKSFMSEDSKIYIKANRKIPILYCNANQLIEVKVSFVFGYRIGSAGKYLVPKVHLTQIKTRVIFFQEVTVFFVMKRALFLPGFVHYLIHASRQAILRYAVFWREIYPQIYINVTDATPPPPHNKSIRHLPHGWSCYRGSTVLH
jgi:hypothetical protein